jgi:hypothetical protein
VMDGAGNTFKAIDLQPEASAESDFSNFVKQLLKRLEELKQDRFQYYDDLRRRNSSWANSSRQLLALLGAIAFLLTGVVAGLRFAPESSMQRWT